jgi:hypothetical protein
MRKKLLVMATAVVLVMGMAGMSFGALVDWADWTSATTGITGSASGTIGSITVNYTGEVNFAQTSGGINYWVAGTANINPFISAVVENAPPASDIIALEGGHNTTSTINFSQAVTNPVMSIVSLGRDYQTVIYQFSQPFRILSSGQGYWGGATTGSLFDDGNNVLRGVEGHGTIQFLGTYSSISWTVPTTEYWHGFTVGLVPVPASALLLGSGLLGLVGMGWRSRKQS